MTRICIVPRVEGNGGMASFRLKFEQGARARGIDISYDPQTPCDALLLIAGTRQLWRLPRARRGVRIVQRLDGINWVQRVHWSGLRYSLRAEYGNALLSLIRRQFADRVIYQSQFIRAWWERSYGVAADSSVILNAVDLQTYSPNGPGERPTDRTRMLLLEGSLAGGLNTGLFHAAALAEQLLLKYPIEVVVAGNVDRGTQIKLEGSTLVPFKFLGVIAREQVPALARSSHLLYCAEVNPPCPNAVIEALACGLPVIGFDSGSLRELVQGDAGRIVDYGANPWKLETPNIAALAAAALDVLQNQEHFRRSARALAESQFGLDKMMDAYLKVLLEN